MTAARRKTVFRIVGAGVLLVLAALIGGGVIGYLGAANPGFDSGPVSLWLIGAIATVLMIASLGFGVVWMRSIDEAAREAHKAAWYWGGSGGMALGGVGIILSTLPGAESWRIPALLDGRTDPAAYAAVGALGITLLMMIGYTIVWAWWWLARR